MNQLSNRYILFRRWIGVAIISLAFSGILSLVVGGARMPSIAKLIQDTSFPRRGLIVHVDIGVLIWFGSISVAIFHLLHALQHRKAPLFARYGHLFVLAGIGCLTGGLFLKGETPLLVNYIPVIEHPIFLGGLVLYFIGILCSFLDFALFRSDNNFNSNAMALNQGPILPKFVVEALMVSRPYVTLGGIYSLIGICSIFIAALKLNTGQNPHHYYEAMMWTGGHALQFVNVCFMLAIWNVFLSYIAHSNIIKRNTLLITSALLTAPLPIFLSLMFSAPDELGTMKTATRLMQFGIFPAVIIYIFSAISSMMYRIQTNSKILDKGSVLAFFMSAFMMVTSFVYGAMIQGSDMRIPGHYHMAIGSVTLAMMAFVMIVVGKNPAVTEIASDTKDKPLNWMIMTYSIGQIIFSTGLFITGSYGVARKTYGVDQQQVTSIGQKIGFAIWGIGGLLALVGGGIFAVVALKRYFAYMRFSNQLQTKMDQPSSVER